MNNNNKNIEKGCHLGSQIHESEKINMNFVAIGYGIYSPYVDWTGYKSVTCYRTCVEECKIISWYGILSGGIYKNKTN